jgi:hypothetical protein
MKYVEIYVAATGITNSPCCANQKEAERLGTKTRKDRSSGSDRRGGGFGDKDNGHHCHTNKVLTIIYIVTLG